MPPSFLSTLSTNDSAVSEGNLEGQLSQSPFAPSNILPLLRPLKTPLSLDHGLTASPPSYTPEDLLGAYSALTNFSDLQNLLVCLLRPPPALYRETSCCAILPSFARGDEEHIASMDIFLR